ncbi:MAG: hypothetical protein CM1200mP41_09690 [Gammaproteobacteria bacterium]|nr:MAG: hypothetical protein CM1200mP41_09690 [Gammaproteobacteria bacterium]
MLQAIGRWTGVPLSLQGPALLVGLGHGATHWIAAFFYLLLPFMGRDLGLSYADTGLLVAVFHLSALVANFGSGLLVDLSGRRIVFQIASLIIGAVALLAYRFGLLTICRLPCSWHSSVRQITYGILRRSPTCHRCIRTIVVMHWLCMPVRQSWGHRGTAGGRYAAGCTHLAADSLAGRTARICHHCNSPLGAVATGSC